MCNTNHTTEQAMQPGIYTSDQLTNEQYHASEGVSNSGLKLILRSPAHFKSRPKYDSTRAKEIGSAIHCAILEPERYSTDYVIVDCADRKKKEYNDACKLNPKDRTLTREEGEGVSGMQRAVFANTAARSLLLACPSREVSVFAIDPETGLLVKCRFDIAPNAGVAGDLKKCQDVRPREFSNSIQSYGYHMQVAFYSDVYYWATGERIHSMPIIAVEEQRPHACKVYEIGQESIDVGRTMYRKALDIYKESLDSGEWPAYGDEVEPIEIPGWALNQFEDSLEVNFDQGE
jgi:hypothetical protein